MPPTKVMLRSSTIFCVSLLAGCCRLSPMPVRPHVVTHDREPVVAHNPANQTYTVTTEMVREAAQNKIYVREVGIWQRQNNVR